MATEEEEEDEEKENEEKEEELGECGIFMKFPNASTATFPS